MGAFSAARTTGNATSISPTNSDAMKCMAPMPCSRNLANLHIIPKPDENVTRWLLLAVRLRSISAPGSA